ncbi:UDP-glucose 4-epimerase GalE [Olivibacter sitiensis]|uniref:UDP-glucose 4-epimerase GalE n=1 Tax=Olivibacter sitiensis TaxID=376470 RepID=UPI00041DB746|nr:UDP-glucose 4-epimerase GalE [Olivibacter sitiensis]
MSKILVTGGTGYIGSHTVVELINAGYTPIIVDNLSNSNIGVLKQLEKITGKLPEFHNFDLCDEEKVKKFIEEHTDIEGVIHFAASKAVGESVAEPVKYYHNNFFSLINLLNAYKGKPVNFVFSSSCTVYGQPEQLPVTESSPVQKAESPYGNTKQVAEEILTDTAHAFKNYNIISLRYFNPVGAHESALIGELPLGIPQNLVPFITQSAIGKRGPITVYGDDYNTPDGSAIRDYIHVVDLAKAHVAAIKLLKKGTESNYDVFNLGTGKGSSVLEVIKAFEDTTGVKLDYTIGPRRSGDVEQVWGDVSKAEKILGWKSTLDIADMMKSAWAWEVYLKEKNPFNL